MTRFCGPARPQARAGRARGGARGIGPVPDEGGGGRAPQARAGADPWAFSRAATAVTGVRVRCAVAGACLDW
ncbi:hypothetical protein [Longispora urticae]